MNPSLIIVICENFQKASDKGEKEISSLVHLRNQLLKYLPRSDSIFVGNPQPPVKFPMHKTPSKPILVKTSSIANKPLKKRQTARLSKRVSFAADSSPAEMTEITEQQTAKKKMSKKPKKEEKCKPENNNQGDINIRRFRKEEETQELKIIKFNESALAIEEVIQNQENLHSEQTIDVIDQNYAIHGHHHHHNSGHSRNGSGGNNIHRDDHYERHNHEIYQIRKKSTYQSSKSANNRRTSPPNEHQVQFHSQKEKGYREEDEDNEEDGLDEYEAEDSISFEKKEKMFKRKSREEGDGVQEGREYVGVGERMTNKSEQKDMLIDVENMHVSDISD